MIEFAGRQAQGAAEGGHTHGLVYAALGVEGLVVDVAVVAVVLVVGAVVGVRGRAVTGSGFGYEVIEFFLGVSPGSHGDRGATRSYGAPCNVERGRGRRSRTWLLIDLE